MFVFAPLYLFLCGDYTGITVSMELECHRTHVGQEYVLVDVHSQAATQFLNSLVEIAIRLCCSLNFVFVFVVVIIMRLALNNSQNASNQKGNKISNQSR